MAFRRKRKSFKRKRRFSSRKRTAPRRKMIRRIVTNMAEKKFFITSADTNISTTEIFSAPLFNVVSGTNSS